MEKKLKEHAKRATKKKPHPEEWTMIGQYQTIIPEVETIPEKGKFSELPRFKEVKSKALGPGKLFLVSPEKHSGFRDVDKLEVRLGMMNCVRVKPRSRAMTLFF